MPCVSNVDNQGTSHDGRKFSQENSPTNIFVLMTSTGAVSVVVTSPEIMLAPT